jgi:glycosylphosphatidylinositol deacylase
MRRRSSGSAAEEEGEDLPSNAEITSTSGAGGRSIAQDPIPPSRKDIAATLQSTALQSNPHNSAHELDRRTSTDQRPSTARSRLPSTTNWKTTESRDEQIEKKRPVDSAIMNVPSKGTIAVAKMSDSRSRSQNTRRSKLQSVWSCSLLTLVTTTVATLFLVGIIHSFTSRQLDTKGCRMSYMRPSFAKLTDFDTEHTRFASKYSVYLYREGGVDEDTKVWRGP